MANKQRALSQYMTPLWVAEHIVERHFSDLDSSDMVVEPSCGVGSFLSALPPDVPAIGVEIDPVLADVARGNTGREIITGDFCTARLTVSPTCLIGNPPFSVETIERFLARAHAMLPTGGRVGFIVPAYALQTAETVARMADRWSMYQEMIPRNIFANLKQPLAFAIFSKDLRRLMVGFALYREAADLKQMPAQVRKSIEHATRSEWCMVVAQAIYSLGGRANLNRLYKAIEGGRPTRTEFWREQIRRTLRRYSDVFSALGGGEYSLADSHGVVA